MTRMFRTCEGTGDLARRRAAVRQRRGFLTPDDFDGRLPPGIGVTSDCYWARSRVAIGDTRQQLTA